LEYLRDHFAKSNFSFSNNFIRLFNLKNTLYLNELDKFLDFNSHKNIISKDLVFHEPKMTFGAKVNFMMNYPELFKFVTRGMSNDNDERFQYFNYVFALNKAKDLYRKNRLSFKAIEHLVNPYTDSDLFRKMKKVHINDLSKYVPEHIMDLIMFTDTSNYRRNKQTMLGIRTLYNKYLKDRQRF